MSQQVRCSVTFCLNFSLHILTHANAVTVGVVYRRASALGGDVSGSTECIVHARREVVICAGAVQSPVLLMVSGNKFSAPQQKSELSGNASTKCDGLVRDWSEGALGAARHPRCGRSSCGREFAGSGAILELPLRLLELWPIDNSSTVYFLVLFACSCPSPCSCSTLCSFCISALPDLGHTRLLAIVSRTITPQDHLLLPLVFKSSVPTYNASLRARLASLAQVRARVSPH